jgi:hypothetical protein
MLYPGGDVWGYREMAPSAPYRQVLRLPARNPIPPKATPLEMEFLEYPTYQNFTDYGDAPDDYPEDWIQIGFPTRMIIVTIAENAVDIQWSYDGETVNVEKTQWRSDRQAHSVRAFRVRNHTRGAVAWYQVLGLR